MKIILIIIAIILAAPIIFITTLILFIMVIFGGSSRPDPPKPKIKYGEFPFRLEYEIDGERFVVEDTLICEYDRIVWNEGMGKHRKWKKHVASSGEENVLLFTDDTTLIDNKIKLYCYIGKAEYYMGDDGGWFPEKKPLTPHIYWVQEDRSVIIRSETIDEIKEKHNIKLISWEFSEPIVNSFK